MKRVDVVGALEKLRGQAVSAGRRNRKQAEELIGFVQKRKAKIAREFYEIGAALGKLAEPHLYAAAGYATFGELLEGRGLFGRTYAFRLIAVARALPKREALRLGADKAYELTRYVAATPEDDVARALAQANAVIAGKALSALSVRELQSATRAVRARARRGKSDPQAREAGRVARETQARLRKRAGREVDVVPVRGKAGWRLRIELPIDDLSAVIRRG